MDLSSEDMKIVKDEPEKRRKFIDRELCQIKPGYYSDLSNYKRVLRQRNVYLKESAIDISILDIWDHELARYGAKVISRRDEFILKINDISKEIHGSISGGKETLNVKYEANVEKSADPADTESVFYEKLLKTRDDDIRNRTTGIGPHKDDLKISADGVDLRKFGSQGQQRTAALSLKLSEIKLIEDEMGEKPILLLDDVLSELDSKRQNYLLDLLCDTQNIITCTGLDEFVNHRFHIDELFHVVNGTATKVENLKTLYSTSEK
mgnify:CR=1 FL=1